MKYYVFNNEEIAKGAENYICSCVEKTFPIVGINAKTKKLENNKQKTVKWDKPKQRIDGKWIIAQVQVSDLLKCPQEKIDEFLNTFKAIIEEYSNEWFPAVGEI